MKLTHFLRRDAASTSNETSMFKAGVTPQHEGVPLVSLRFQHRKIAYQSLHPYKIFFDADDAATIDPYYKASNSTG